MTKNTKITLKDDCTIYRGSTALLYELSFLFQYLQACDLHKPGISMQNDRTV